MEPNTKEAEMTTNTYLENTDPRLAEAIQEISGLQSQIYHTGGGVMVLEIDLTQDGRFLGPVAWLTRDDGWQLGFYDFAKDPDDMGDVVTLFVLQADQDNPDAVANAVEGLLTRVSEALVWRTIR